MLPDQPEDDEGAQAFADLVTNFLGVLIVVVLVLQSSAAVRDQSPPPLRPGEASPHYGYSAPMRDHRPPFADAYYVYGRNVAPIEWEQISRAVRDGRISADGVPLPILGDRRPPAQLTALGMQPPHATDEMGWKSETDLTTYFFNLELPDERSSSGTVPDEDIAALADRLITAATKSRRSLNFIVATSGFDLFSPLFQELSRRQVCFRWTEHDPSTKLSLYRIRAQFGLYSNRRCRVGQRT